jgi:hypothetical protein
MKQKLDTVPEQKERLGTPNGLTFIGWEYHDGWFVSVFSDGDESTCLLWVDGNFVVPVFRRLHIVHRTAWV